MDALKLIPQAFFDVIGRMVPGATAIVAALLLTGTTWEYWLSKTLGQVIAEKSPSTSFVVLVASAYVAGQLLSPLAKLVQRIGELFGYEPTGYPKGYQRKGKFLRETKFYLYSLVRPEPKAKGYDWLRANHLEAGAHCAKIRGEFTMHNGLAAVFLLSAAAYPLHGRPWHYVVLTLLVGVGTIELVRGRTTRDTFNETVRKLAQAKGYAEKDAA